MDYEPTAEDTEAQRGSDRYDEWRDRRDLERWEAEQDELKEVK